MLSQNPQVGNVEGWLSGLLIGGVSMRELEAIHPSLSGSVGKLYLDP